MEDEADTALLEATGARRLQEIMYCYECAADHADHGTRLLIAMASHMLLQPVPP